MKGFRFPWQLPISSQSRLNVRNGIWSGLEYVANLGSLLVLTPLILNLRGDAELGLFILANSLTGLSGMFSLGLSQATLKQVSDFRATGREEEVPGILNASLLIYGGLGILLVGTLSLAAPWLAESVFGFPPPLRDAAARTLVWGGYGLFAFLLGEVSSSIFQAYERYDMSSALRGALRLVSLVLQIGLLVNGKGVEMLVEVQVAFLMLTAGILWGLVPKCVLPCYTLRKLPPWNDMKALLSFGGMTWVGSVFGALRNRGDIFLVGALLGPAEVSVYTVALRLPAQVHALLAKCFHFLFPYVSKLHAAGDKLQLQCVYHRYTALIALAGFTCMLPLAVAAHPILRFWLNADMADQAAPMMQIMAFRFVVFPLSIVNMFFLLGTGKVKLMTLQIAVNSVLSLAAIGWGVLEMGIRGAAWGQLAYLILLVMNRGLVEYTLFGSIMLWRTAGPVVLCLGGLAAALAMTRHNLFSNFSDYSLAVLMTIGVWAVAAAPMLYTLWQSKVKTPKMVNA